MSLFVLDLGYTAPIEQVDALMADHRAWLAGHYGDGTFLASGRKEPRTGGVILAHAESRQAVDELVASDPFSKGGVVQYTVTEFLPTMTAPQLADFRVTL